MSAKPKYVVGKRIRYRYPKIQNLGQYHIWQKMLRRCYCPDDANYHNYGAKGITVCERWRSSFDLFVEDMGIRPNGLTLERVDNSIGYSPDNCRWATRSEQSRNTCRNKNFTYDGKTMCLTDWAKEVGLSKATVIMRVRRGWTIDQAILTPLNQCRSTGAIQKVDGD